MAVLIELEDLPATDRLDVLRERMLKGFVPLDLRPYSLTNLTARSSIHRFGALTLQSTFGSGGRTVRTRRLAADDTPPQVIVTVLEAGTSVVAQYERVAHLRPGDLVAYWSAAPFSTSFETGTLRHSFRLGVAALGLPERLVRDQLGRLLGPGHPLAVVVSSYLLRLAGSAPDLDSDQRSAVERPTIDLLRAVFTEAAGQSHLGRAPLADSIVARIFEYLESHFHEHDLDTARIASVHGISERYLYSLLARSGTTPGDWIRTRRLDAAAHALVDPAMSFVTVSAIAHDHGFADHSHFAREFRKAFGQTPSEWRRRAVEAK